ncbi:hypothetical protein KC360_g8154 [Hortaea werneckii]|nr:hypothetical protein KC325_g8134 [Hortaea werneckii]KAI7150209.1 hypothetical protein KC344_g370 [Hortaea werneckii]KAI7168286.1 hypothetical protein KC360_g8154 [Hortaea werneckii]
MSLAIPFHPKGQPPKAQCPRCVENGNSEVKSFYPIRGLQDCEFDEQIPKEWLRCPPIKLDGGIPGMEALRHQFQYMNISRYAIRVTKHWKSSAAKQRAMEAAYGKERKQRRQIQNEVLDLKSKIEELEKCEAQLAKWESRKPVINHYLGIVGDMAKSKLYATSSQSWDTAQSGRTSRLIWHRGMVTGHRGSTTTQNFKGTKRTRSTQSM